MDTRLFNNTSNLLISNHYLASYAPGYFGTLHVSSAVVLNEVYRGFSQSLGEHGCMYLQKGHNGLLPISNKNS
jgi:hypothetical protein